MKSKAILILLLATSLQAMAQKVYEPTIVILKPKKVIIDDALKKEVTKLNNLIKDRSKGFDWEERKKLIEKNYKNEPENVRIMENRKLAFMKEIDYFSSLSTISELFLQYKLFPQFENLLIYAVPEKSLSSDAKNLYVISEKYDSRYVLTYKAI